MFGITSARTRTIYENVSPWTFTYKEIEFVNRDQGVCSRNVFDTFSTYVRNLCVCRARAYLVCTVVQLKYKVPHFSKIRVLPITVEFFRIKIFSQRLAAIITKTNSILFKKKNTLLTSCDYPFETWVAAS